MARNPFDERAASWDEDPAKRERALVAAEAVRRAVPLDPSTRMLEYGAGTGLVTEALRAEVGAVTLADSSGGMLEVLRGKVEAGVFEGAVVWDLDLGRDPVPDDRVDLVVTVLTLHHIPEVAQVVHGFAALLAAGGHLCVIDLEEEDGSFHEDPGIEVHHGFGQDTLSVLLGDAGFEDVRFFPAGEIERHGRDYPMFLAVARKP